MDTKTGNCSCGKRSVLLRKIGDTYLCVTCAAASSRLSEEAHRQLQEDTDGKDVLMD